MDNSLFATKHQTELVDSAKEWRKRLHTALWLHQNFLGVITLIENNDIKNALLVFCWVAWFLPDKFCCQQDLYTNKTKINLDCDCDMWAPCESPVSPLWAPCEPCVSPVWAPCEPRVSPIWAPCEPQLGVEPQNGGWSPAYLWAPKWVWALACLKTPK